MAWRVARSLDVLLGQLNAAAPKRSKVSDGAIGDAAHASRDSDHNPWLKVGAMGVVTARDFTHDPAGGLDCNRLAADLVASGDKRIKYVIWNRRIWAPGKGWQPYGGSNPHTKHLHLSVAAAPAMFDSAGAWRVLATTPKPAPTPAPAPAPQEDDDMFTDQDRQIMGEIRAQLTGSARPNEYPGLPADLVTNGKPRTVVQALGDLANGMRSIYDTLTPGKTGVKLNGDVWAKVTDTHARVAGLEAAVRALAEARGGDLDVDALVSRVDTAVRDAMTDTVRVEVTVPDDKGGG